jgi:hypothetical protein
MAEAMNNNLAEIGNGDFTDDEMVVVKEIVGETGTADGGMKEAETLKSLIIKTAQLIKSEIDAYNLKLIGTYEADGKLGKYVRKTRLDVDVTPTGIQQNYTFQDIIQGLKTYEVNAKNYIKTGYLRTENSIPIYGVAIGKDVVTFSEDGTETYNDGNKVAELTADELSFWQNGNKIASYTGTAITLYSGTSKRLVIDGDGVSIYKGTALLAKYTDSGTELYQNGNMIAKYAGSRISFYYGGNEVFYILNGKMYAAGDMEITSGNELKIVSGGTFTVDTVNMTVSSSTGAIRGYKYDSQQHLLAVYGIDTDGFYLADGVGLFLIQKEGSGDLPANAGISFSKLYSADSNHYGGGVLLHGECIVLGKTVFQDDDPWLIPYANNTCQIGCSDKKISAIYATNVNYVNLVQSSSKDIKHDIRDMDSVGERLDRLRPVTFVYDDDPEERRRTGLIYEETEPVMPEICTGDEENKAISYMELVPMMLKEIQDLRARVKALEEREE